MNEEQRENVKVLIALRIMYGNAGETLIAKTIDDIIMEGIKNCKQEIITYPKGKKDLYVVD